MLVALLSDLAVIGGHQLVTTVDPRVMLAVPPGVEAVTLSPGAENDRHVSRPSHRVGRCRLADRARDRPHARASGGEGGKEGPHTPRVRSSRYPQGLRQGRTPAHSRPPRDRSPGNTSPHQRRGPWGSTARELGYPIVVKPARGAGSEGVWLARNARELRHAVAMARRTGGRERLLLQRYVRGVAASVSLLADGRQAVALSANSQAVRVSRQLSYRGGTTPLDHPMARLGGRGGASDV